MPADHGEDRVAAHRAARHHGLADAEVIEQERRVVRNPLHRKRAVAGRRGAEAAGIEANDAMRRCERLGLTRPHEETERKGVQEQQRRAVAAHVVVEF